MSTRKFNAFILSLTLRLISRVGRSITPPNVLSCPATNSTMPTAAAVAAAAATAKIQALDAVASNAVLGLAQNTPGLGIAAKVNAMPVITAATTAAALHPALAVPTAPVAALLPPGMYQAPALGGPSLLGVPTGLPTLQSVAPTLPPPALLATPPAVALATALPAPAPIGVAEASNGASAVMSVAANNAAATAANLSENIKKAQEKQQEELQKKLMDEGDVQTLQQQENMSIKGQSARQLVMQRLMRPQDSRVIILRNMVGPDDVDESLQEEIQEECSKFGTVSRVIIFNEKQTENEDDDEAEIIVKIFVEFSAGAEAIRGKDALHGRFFGGRRVVAELYDQSLFDQGDLSG